MSEINIEDLKIQIEKLEKMRANQLKANKKYYQKNKETIKQAKKQKYNDLKEKCNYSEILRQRAKKYYEKNKEVIKKKNLERYHQIKEIVEFPELKL